MAIEKTHKQNKSVLARSKKHAFTLAKSLFWFSVGACLGLFFLTSFTLIIFQKSYTDVVYPGVTITGINFSGKTKEEVKTYFTQKNASIANTEFIFTINDDAIKTTAHKLDMGYNADLLANQAYSIGRSDNMFSNVSLLVQAYLYTITLPPAYQYSDEKLMTLLTPTIEKNKIQPVDALFTFQDGKVSAFRPSSDGQEIDVPKVKQQLTSKIPFLFTKSAPKTISVPLSITVLPPAIATDEANDLGIKELIGTGNSLFQHSIPNRIYNVTLASTRMNGVLIAPNEVFSFAKALGDVSTFTGYKQAYIIQNGRTVLGDGGGVCQVSTTLFRALLNAGLPILERHPHAYRVGYYEQDSPPGIDASVYVPSLDLKFKNDTGHYILIQTALDPTYQSLTFNLYGTRDNREVVITKPVITNQTAAPEPLYQDDPTLPKGEVKQVDFAAPGATVYFTREVKKDGKVLLADKFTSHYRAWQAVYLRGTKE